LQPPAYRGLKLTSADERRGGKPVKLPGPGRPEGGPVPDHIAFLYILAVPPSADCTQLTFSHQVQVTLQLWVGLCDLVWRFVTAPPLLGGPIKIFYRVPNPLLAALKLPTQLHLLPMLRSATITLLPLYAFAVPVVIFEVHCTLSQLSISDFAVRSLLKNYF
jgi:hypothetical protein